MTIKKNIKLFTLLIFVALLTSCTVGPNYQRPPIPVPASYKEVNPQNWSQAKPADDFDRGQWWKVFHSQQLNTLEAQLNISNQNIAAAAAQYQQSLALIKEARASYFPTITASASVIPQLNSSSSSGSNAISSNTTTVTQAGLDGTWQADLWGGIRRTVEASVAGAQMSAAQ